jgi:hypothetical protein
VKQKRMNRVLAALLAAAMMFQMLPMLAFAAEDTHLENGQAKIGDKVYGSVLEAVKAAPADGSTTTITLGEGEYTLYGTEETAGKNLTFVGQGVDSTTWKIGYPTSDQAGYGNADFSFKNSKTITFQNMTLKAGPTYNYQGFAHTDTTVVENCVVEGMTFYWGYNSATFKDTTFKPLGYKYALWTYCSEDTIFDHCKFECEGKAIYVHNEGNPLIKIHFKDCEVTNSRAKSALNVDDGPCSFKIYISGDNKVSAKRDTNTCSKVYGFAGNNGHTEVYYGEENENPELVWQNGQMVTHKHSDGEKDNAYTFDSVSEWENKGDHFERKVTKTCSYCKRQFPNVTEKGYQLSYDLHDGTGAAGVDYESKIYPEGEKATVAAAPAREGFYFLGWKDENDKQYNADATITLTANTTLTAQWGDVPPVEPGTPAGGGSGDGGAGVVVAGALLGGAGYLLGTRLWLESTFGFVPANRIELAMALWKRADCPAPVSTELYPDIDEDDTDAQAAARWCVEQDLMKDFARTNSDGTQTVKFKPYDYVFRPQSLVKWYKLEKLLNEQQSTNA